MVELNTSCTHYETPKCFTDFNLVLQHACKIKAYENLCSLFPAADRP